MPDSRYETVLILCEQSQGGKIVPVHVFIEEGSPLAFLREAHLKDVREILVRLKELGWRLMSIWRIGKAPSDGSKDPIAYLWYKALFKIEEVSKPANGNHVL